MPDKRVTRLLYGAFFVFAAAFIVSSVVQIASAVFGGGSSAADVKASPACAAALDAETKRIDRALGAATGAATEAAAAEAFVSARGPAPAEREDLARACAGSPDERALSAVARLDHAALVAVRRQSHDLGTVRREVDSIIR